jgi:hypothetical protein
MGTITGTPTASGGPALQIDERRAAEFWYGASADVATADRDWMSAR